VIEKNLRISILLLGSLFFSVAAFAQQNSLQPGGFYFGQAPAGSRVLYQGHPLQLTEENRFLIGFGRDADLQQQLFLIDEKGQKTLLSLQLSPRSYKIEKIDGISKKMMEPSAEDLIRIQHEASLVRQARTLVSPLPNFSETFIWPIKGRISGVYGSQRIFNGEPRRPHYGIDIAAPSGTPVIAPAGGTIRLAHSGMFFSGKTLIIDHGFGLSSSYLHLNKILVKEGDKVQQGEEIALVGATGRVTGPHLDWRVNWLDKRLDPALWVKEMLR